MSVCSDEFLATEGLENQKFCEETLDWVLQESGVLRTRDIRHQKQGTTLSKTELSTSYQSTKRQKESGIPTFRTIFNSSL